MRDNRPELGTEVAARERSERDRLPEFNSGRADWFFRLVSDSERVGVDREGRLRPALLLCRRVAGAVRVRVDLADYPVTGAGFAFIGLLVP